MLRDPQRMATVRRVVGGRRVDIGLDQPADGGAGRHLQPDRVEADMGTVRIAAHQHFDHCRHREDPLERRGSRQDGAARERSARNTPVEGTPRELLKVIDQLVSAGRGALCIPGDNRRQGRGVDLRILRKAACVLD